MGGVVGGEVSRSRVKLRFKVRTVICDMDGFHAMLLYVYDVGERYDSYSA